jgi:hypothetical protein
VVTDEQGLGRSSCDLRYYDGVEVLRETMKNLLTAFLSAKIRTSQLSSASLKPTGILQPCVLNRPLSNKRLTFSLTSVGTFGTGRCTMERCIAPRILEFVL